MGFPVACRPHRGSIHGQTSGQLLPGRPGICRDRGVESGTAQTAPQAAGRQEGWTVVPLGVEVSRCHCYAEEPARSPQCTNAAALARAPSSEPWGSSLQWGGLPSLEGGSEACVAAGTRWE